MAASAMTALPSSLDAGIRYATAKVEMATFELLLGLVALCVVASVAKLMVPSLPWWAAVALGAIVAPPDAVAASSVLRQFRLPKRIMVVLEGESLIDDASSLVLYRFAVAAVAAGTVSYSRGALQFAVSTTLIVSRFAWIFPTAWLPRAMSARMRERDPMPPRGELVVSSWAGMRGVVILAAALALPTQFPSRDIIVFLAFCAIFATLVLQGTTLGWVVHRLGIAEAEPVAPTPEEAEARANLADAALEAVKSHVGAAGAAEHTVAAGELVEEYETRFDRASADDPQTTAERQGARHRLRLVAIAAAREKLKEHTDQIETETHRILAEELDLEEQQIRSALGEEEGTAAKR